MKIKLYRGARQIGGCVVGISTAKTSILVDMGSVLPDTKGSLPDDRLSIEEPYDAVVFTHNHVDHTGLMEYISPHIPLYMGEKAKEIYYCIKEHENSPLLERIAGMNTYHNGASFLIGDLKITPLLTDHSAFDAYMLLIEGEGKAVLHTGDYRLHGLKGKDVIPGLSALYGKVDVMITEGTNLSYDHPVTRPERELSKCAEVLMDRFPYTFVMCSAADFDRLASFHRASAARGPFYCDTYQRKLLDIAASGGEVLSELYRFDGAKVYIEGAADGQEGFCMAVRRNRDFESIMKKFAGKYPEKCLFIYSMSESYLKRHKSAIDKMTADFRYKVKLHTSGHGSGEAIWRAVQAVSPSVVIPVHTERPEKIRLGSCQNRLLFLEDGKSYDIL